MKDQEENHRVQQWIDKLCTHNSGWINGDKEQICDRLSVDSQINDLYLSRYLGTKLV